jgi:hypothetical protein
MPKHKYRITCAERPSDIHGTLHSVPEEHRAHNNSLRSFVRALKNFEIMIRVLRKISTTQFEVHPAHINNYCKGLYCMVAKRRRLSLFARRRILLAVMSPRNEVFQAVTFDGATSDAKEPLIAAGDAEDEDQGLEERGGDEGGRTLSSFKALFSALGIAHGFLFTVCVPPEANSLVIYFEMKSNTNIIAFSLLWSLFTAMAAVGLNWEFIRYLETIAYSAVGGRSGELRENAVLQLECHFGVGVLAGLCLASWTIMDAFMGTRAHVECTSAIMMFAFIWYKVTMASATDISKPSSTRRSTAEQTMMTV